MVRYSEQDEIRIVPRTSWLVQLAGACFFAVVIAVVLLYNLRTFSWRLGAVIGIAFLLITFVIALRPPLLVLRPGGISIRRFFRSIDVPRSGVIGYHLGPAHRVIGGETNSRSRHLFLDVRTADSIQRVPAFWCDRFVGLLYSGECVKVKATLDQWMAEPNNNLEPSDG
jgi:hypothetical protein